MASIKKRKNDYLICASNGRDGAGKQIREYTTWQPDPDKTDKQNEKDLQLFALEFERKVKARENMDGGKITYADFARMWLDNYIAPKSSETTYETYQGFLENIVLPQIGKLKLKKIKSLHVQRIYNNMRDNGYERNGKYYPYAGSSIKRVHEMLRSSFNTAITWHMIDSNPCDGVAWGKPERRKMVKCFTLEQTKIFLDLLDKPYKVVYRGRQHKDGTRSAERVEIHTITYQQQVLLRLTLFTSARRGEVLSLRWQDIDMDSDTVDINKSTARTKKSKQHIKETKSETSDRLVSIPDMMIPFLQKLKQEQENIRQVMGDEWNPEGYLFTQANGKQMDIGTPNKTMRELIRRYNDTCTDEKDKLPEINLHGLRHTGATLLISENTDIKTVQAVLGHADISTTMNIYAHSLQSKQQKAASVLGDLLS